MACIKVERCADPRTGTGIARADSLRSIAARDTVRDPSTALALLASLRMTGKAGATNECPITFSGHFRLGTLKECGGRVALRDCCQFFVGAMGWGAPRYLINSTSSICGPWSPPSRTSVLISPTFGAYQSR